MSDNATMKNTTIHDMTTGSPARLIMQFMIPMFLGNIFQQFYNIADFNYSRTVSWCKSTGCNWKYRLADVLCDRLAEWSE